MTEKEKGKVGCRKSKSYEEESAGRKSEVSYANLSRV